MNPFYIVVAALVTPLLEKNPAKTVALATPVVLSMARVVVLSFAVAMLRQIWMAGIAGWPEATLSIAIVLALPILGAIDRVKPEAVMQLADGLLGRFGKGAARGIGSVYDREPSKFDDHRDDAA